MDVNRCISLHNAIVHHGWLTYKDRPQYNKPGEPPAHFETMCPTWTQFHGAKAEEYRSQMSPELWDYLSGARMHIGSDEAFSFHYWINGPSGPDELFYLDDFLNEEWAKEELETGFKRYLFLFVANQTNTVRCHRQGLIFDNKLNLAIYCPTVEEVGTAMNTRFPWYPLDQILQTYLEMIKNGNIHDVPDDDRETFDNPWVVNPCSDIMIQKTIDAFDALVEAIETRMPAESHPRGSTSDHDDYITYGLLDSTTLQLAIAKSIISDHGFTYEFLRRARRPKFLRIAPGLEIPTPSNFTAQPLLNLSYYDLGKPFYPPLPFLRPLLLFRSKMIINESIMTCHAMGDGHTDRRRPSYGWPQRFNAGVYIRQEEDDFRRYDDEFMFLLPFGIGEKGFARMSDGARFGENRENDFRDAKEYEELLRRNITNAWAELYRPGYQPFEDFREHRLVTLLESWKERVESGDWSVGENGVEGTMDVWREADTEEAWEKYVLPVG